MIYCFDIDGTICSNTEGKYEAAQPFWDVIARIKSLRADGHTIYFQTARGSTTGIDWSEVTRKQLREWGLEHDGVYFGKPTADLYIDDKCAHIRDWMQKGQ